MALPPLLTPTSIRLLEIHGEDDFGLIECSVEVVDLNDNPIYNCLSYTWGHPNPAARPLESEDYASNALWPVSCNGELVEVTLNLRHALHKLYDAGLSIVEQPDEHGQTRLFHALEGKDVDLVEHLLHNGADIESHITAGETAARIGTRKKKGDVSLKMTNREDESEPSQSIENISPLSSSSLYLVNPDVQNDLDSLIGERKTTSRPGVRRNFIWIDALCIDQSETALEERSAQVNLMSRIYRSAESVVVWLGPEDEFSQTAAEMISWVGNDRLKEKWDFFVRTQNDTFIAKDNVNTGKALEVLRVKEKSKAEWLALTMFFQRSWFERVWIVQEMVLAKRVIMFCGSVQISFSDLLCTSLFITTSTWAVWLRQESGSRNAIGGGPISWRMGPLDTTFQLSGLSNTPRYIGGTLLSRLDQVFPASATDPRDKVFGILGIIRPASTITWPTTTLTADYRMSVQDVYIAAQKALLPDYPGLFPLSYCLGQSRNVTIDLPSWVVDWNATTGRHTMIAMMGKALIFSASQSLPRQMHFPAAKCPTLSLYGCEFDTVSLTGHSIEDMKVYDGSIVSWLDLILSLPMVYHTGEDRSDAFWRTMIANIYEDQHPAPASTRESCVDWLYTRLVHCAQQSGIARNDSRVAYVTQAAKLEKLGLWSLDRSYRRALQESESGWHLVQDYAAAFRMMYAWRRLFRTSKNYIGIGHQELREGDVVCIMPGASVPFVLRRLDDGNYLFLGEAYVHGLMHGEALQADWWHLKEFLIV